MQNRAGLESNLEKKMALIRIKLKENNRVIYVKVALK